MYKVKVATVQEKGLKTMSKPRDLVWALSRRAVRAAPGGRPRVEDQPRRALRSEVKDRVEKPRHVDEP